jgi:hypothetical protein
MSFSPISLRSGSFSRTNSGTFLFTVLLFLVISQSSCSVIEESLDASGVSSSSHEGGASANPNASQLGVAVSIGILSSLPQNTSHHSDRVSFLDDYDMPAAPGQFALSSNLGFIQKGYKFTGTKVRFNYLELREDVLYNYSMHDGSSLFGGLGPYIAYGIGGRAGGSGFSENSFGGQDGYKRFDLGLNLTGGYKLPSGLYFRLGYDFGIANTSPAPDFSARNRSFSFGVGYSISKIVGHDKKK